MSVELSRLSTPNLIESIQLQSVDASGCRICGAKRAQNDFLMHEQDCEAFKAMEAISLWGIAKIARLKGK